MKELALEPPPEYLEARRNFYLGKAGQNGEPDSDELRAYMLFIYAHIALGTKKAFELHDGLFWEPLRRGDHNHFRRIADAIDNFKIKLGCPNPCRLKDHDDTPEQYFFIAFEILYRNPAVIGKWPSRSDVRNLALKMWAMDRLEREERFAKSPSDLTSERSPFNLTSEEETLVKSELKNLKERVPWRIWKTTGLEWLEPRQGKNLQGQTKKGGRKPTFFRGKR